MKCTNHLYLRTCLVSALPFSALGIQLTCSSIPREEQLSSVCFANNWSCSFLLPTLTISGTAWLSVYQLTVRPRDLPLKPSSMFTSALSSLQVELKLCSLSDQLPCATVTLSPQ